MTLAECSMSSGTQAMLVAEGSTLHLLDSNKITCVQPLLAEQRILNCPNAVLELDIPRHPSSNLKFEPKQKVKDPLQNNIKNWAVERNALEAKSRMESDDSKACMNSWNYEGLVSLDMQDDKFRDSRQQEGNCMDLLSLEEAINVLHQTDELLSIESYICIVQKCRRKKSPLFGKHVYALLCKNGLEVHEALGNNGVPMLVDCGSLPEALQLFNRLVHVTEHGWTSLILGHAQIGQLQCALNLYQSMQEDNVHPSSHTLVTLLKTCARLNAVDVGRRLHKEIAQKGFEKDFFVCNTLIHMYAKCGL
eukprot:c24206_g11_i1 orf=2-916(-)